MKLIAYLLAVVTVVSGAFAVDVQKSFIVSYPAGTPDHIIEEAKQAIIDAKGYITHEYQLFKGFAATAGEKVYESVQDLGLQYNALVEEDQTVSIRT